MPPSSESDHLGIGTAGRLAILTRRAYATGQGVLPDHLEDLDPAQGPQIPIASHQPASRRRVRRRRDPWRWAISRRLALAAFALLAATTVILAIGMWAPWRQPEIIDLPPRPEAASMLPSHHEPAAPTQPERPPDVAVHVAGAVNRPGVVTLPGGARAADALREAGGATAEAEMDAINLARILTDGEQLYVPRIGEASGPAPGAAEQPGDVSAGPVNLNTANASQLQQLSGIGPALAQRIIDWRDAHGGFHSVDELLEVSGIGATTLERLRAEVTV